MDKRRRTANVASWRYAFGFDKTRVDGFALANAHSIARLFLPIIIADLPSSTTSWGNAAEIADVHVGAHTTFGDLTTARRRVGGLAPLVQPMGSSDGATLTTLVETIERVMGIADPVDVRVSARYALWTGYADTKKIPPFLSAVSSLTDVNGFVVQAGVRGFTGSLRDLTRFGRESGRHLPCAVWLPGPAIAISQPLYHDSLYISGPSQLMEVLAVGALDVAAIDRSAMLPSGIWELG